MKEITLTQDKVDIIDDDDYERVAQFKWHALCHRNKFWYAGAYTPSGQMLMHRFLMSAPKGKLVDHEDHNGLNNQKSNLRLCLHTHNNHNRMIGRDNTSGFKGVRLDPEYNRWRAQIRQDNKWFHLGCFSTAREAALAYDAAALKMHGEFALTNAKMNRFQPRPEAGV